MTIKPYRYTPDSGTTEGFVWADLCARPKLRPVDLWWVFHWEASPQGDAYWRRLAPSEIPPNQSKALTMEGAQPGEKLLSDELMQEIRNTATTMLLLTEVEEKK